MTGTADVESLWQRIAEPIYEDERLRGELDDAAFQLLLDWALAASRRCAERATTVPDRDAAADACSAELRHLVFLAARAAVDGNVAGLAKAVGGPVYTANEGLVVRRALAGLKMPPRAPENAARLAAALSATR